MGPALRSDGRPGESGSGAAAGGDRRRCPRPGAAARRPLLPLLLLPAALLLLPAPVRCAAAAEETSTFDASGSSPSLRSSSVTVASVQATAELSVTEVVPFPVVRSDSDSQSEAEGLSGQPAFSSILTVIAGTVMHPRSLDQTSPTAGGDDTHTTQLPSHSPTQGSDTPSSSSSVGDGFQVSSGLMFSSPQKHSTSLPTIMSESLHVSPAVEKSYLPSLPLVSLKSASSSAASITSLLSLFFHPTSYQHQERASSPAPQTETAALLPAEPLGWKGSFTIAKSTSRRFGVRHGVTHETREASSEPSSQTSTEESSTGSTRLSSPVEQISETYKKNPSSDLNGSVSSFYISHHTVKNHLNFSNNSFGPNQSQNTELNSLSPDNPKSSSPISSNQGSHSVRRQQGAPVNPSSVLLSARTKGYSLSSHVTQQMLQGEAYIEKEHRNTEDRRRNAVMSPLVSHFVNPTVTFTPSKLFFTASSESSSDRMPFTRAAFFELNRVRSSGTASSEDVSDPGDLSMAAGQSSPALPAINGNYNRGEKAEVESGHSYSRSPHKVSLSLTQLTSMHADPSTLTTTSNEASSFTDWQSDYKELRKQSWNVTINDETHQGQEALKAPLITKTALDPADYTKNQSNVIEHQTSDVLTPSSFIKSQQNQDDSTDISVNSDFISSEEAVYHQTPSSPFTSEKSKELIGSSTEISTHLTSQRINDFPRSSERYVISGITQRNTSLQNAHKYNALRFVSPPSFIGNEDSTIIREARAGSMRLTTPFLLKSSQDILVLNKDISSSAELSSKNVSVVKALLHKGYKTASSFSVPEITLSPKTISSSVASIAPASNDKSDSITDRGKAFASAAPSPVTNSFSDGQSSVETSSAIFSFGTKLMALYTKQKATKPMPLQSAAFKLGNALSSFDREKPYLPTDGLLFELQRQKDDPKNNAHASSTDASTAVTGELNPASLTIGTRPSSAFTEGTSNYKEESPVHLKHAVFLSSKPEVINGGSGVPLPPSYVTAVYETSTQASSHAVGYKRHRSPPPTDFKSSGSAFGAAVTLPDTNTVRKRSAPKADSVSSFLVHPSSHTLTFPSPSFTHYLPFYINLITPLSSTQRTSSGESMSPAFSKPAFSLMSPSSEHYVTETFPLPDPETNNPGAGKSESDTPTFPKDREASLTPSQSHRVIPSAGPFKNTSQESPLTPQRNSTAASPKLTTTAVASTPKATTATTMPSFKLTTRSSTSTTPQPTPWTRRATTTVRTHTSRKGFTSPIQRPSPPRVVTNVFVSPFTTTTESPPSLCNITERLWVKTVVSIYVRRNRLDSIQRQNLRRGLSQGLRKALNDSSAQAQVETVFGSPNMTVAYHVIGGDVVYPPYVVVEGLMAYGRDRLIADLRQYLPLVTALPLPVALWRPSPAPGFRLKTVLQFVGAGDDPRSCRFFQMMEQRLEKVFSEAESKVSTLSSRPTVQILSVSQTAASPAVSLVYTVRNGTSYLNGTVASNLLGQLSAELVGYFLFFPPLIIAEPLEYHNLNTSLATRDFWVITVIQDVDNASLEGHYQSFASLMEQRLGELFVFAGQQGTRFRRATTVGSFTVQMVSIRRVSGAKNPAEMTYYVQHNGISLLGTSAAKVLNTVDSQTMALTLGYFVQLQAERSSPQWLHQTALHSLTWLKPVVKNPANNLWIIAAVLAPISVVTLIIIIITAVLCRRNKNDFKADAIGNLNPRAKMAYRRDVSYYHQPVQGFDYAKQHLGQQGGDDETLPVSQDTLVMSLQIRDTSLSLEKTLKQDGTANKSLSTDKHKSKLPSEDGSVISNESERLEPRGGLSVPKVTAQQKVTTEEARKRDDPYDSSSGSLQLIPIKPVKVKSNCSHPVLSDRSLESAMLNGEVNLALKQKSDIEHYRNKLRLKAKKKGYYDFPSTVSGTGGPAPPQRHQNNFESEHNENGKHLEAEEERGSTYVKSHTRHSQVGQPAYRSRQSLSSPSPGGTEMDLLVMRERPRRGIRNSGYDTEPELIQETNVDRLLGPRRYTYGRGLKGHSETSTLSSQPSIDEVRHQMHLLLEEAFSLASGGESTSGRRSHHQQPPPDHYGSGLPSLPYAEVVTSVPGTMSSGRGGLHWVPSYGADMYQCSLPKPAFRFTQLPEMAMGSPPPLPPRTGPPPRTPLRRSTSDLGPKGRVSETSVAELRSQQEKNPYGSTTRAALPSITAEAPGSNYSGNPITAVYSIPAARPDYSEYFVPTSPTSYHSPSWMSYPPEPEDIQPQWTDTVPLPGYAEVFPNPRYPQGSPGRLPLQYNHRMEHPPAAPGAASEQSLPRALKDMDSLPLSSLSTSALVQAIRQEVAKLAKKQNDMFEF